MSVTSDKAVPEMSPSSVDATSVCQLEKSTFSYRLGKQTVEALREVNLRVATGEWVVVMGPSGSGKSTLLLCAAGLLRLGNGKAILAGVDLVNASERQLTALRRRSIGFVFQNLNLVPALSAAQNVALPARFDGKRIQRAAVQEALERVGLAEKAGRRPEELSGGEQQRVAVARALVTRPSIVFADEPTGSLDSKARDTVLNLFESFRQEGTAVLMVTHDPAVASRADRIVWLRDGVIAAESGKSTAEAISAQLASLEASGR